MRDLKKYISTCIFFVAAGVFAYKVINNWVKSLVLTSNSPQIKAVIIDEMNFFGNSPVSQEFSYSYSFVLKNKIYTGNSMESKFNVGDSILIRYLESNPNMNEPVEYYRK